MTEHREPYTVYAAPINRDGRLLAITGADPAIKLWDHGTNEVRLVLPGPGGHYSSADWSRDGGRLVAAGGLPAQIWDTSSGKLLQTLSAGDSSQVNSVKFSPSGDLVAMGSGDGLIRLVGAADGRPLIQTAGHHGQINDLALSADGSTLVTASYDLSAIVWDVETRVARATLRGQDGPVYSVAISPDGDTIATGLGGGGPYVVQLWDAETGELRRELVGHGNMINSLAFSNDGEMLASGSNDNTVKLWDAKAGRERRTLAADQNIRAVAISPDGCKVAAGGPAATIKLWNAETGKEEKTLLGHINSIALLNFLPTVPCSSQRRNMAVQARSGMLQAAKSCARLTVVYDRCAPRLPPTARLSPRDPATAMYGFGIPTRRAANRRSSKRSRWGHRAA